MTHKPAILEALARAIHCHDGRLPTPWDADMIDRWPDDCEYERKVAMSQAAAVLELVGPKSLQFADEMGDGVLTSREKRTLYRCFPQEDGRFFVSHCGFFPTLEAAQAAAQAHADAAHWANCPLGKLAGVV